MLRELEASRLAFRGAAAAIQELRLPEWIISGPAETGKTYAALSRLDYLLATTPRAQGVILRKVLADVAPSVLQTYLRIVAVSKSGGVLFGGNQPKWFDYPNGARLWIAGMDRPGKVLSSERDFIYVNQAEQLSLSDWETLLTRVTGRGAVTDMPMLFGDCNPGGSRHWIRERERIGALRLLQSKHEDNPTLFDEEGSITEQGKRTLARLDSLTGVRYQRYRLGRWASAEGVVYEAFDPTVHVWSIDEYCRRYNRKNIPLDWPRVRVIDFGLRNPFCCLWFAKDPDGAWICYRELYMTGRTVMDHIRTIATVEQWYGKNGRDGLQHDPVTGRLLPPTNDRRERFQATVCDHDAGERQILRDNHIPNIAAIKDVARGIQAVQLLLGKPAGHTDVDPLTDRRGEEEARRNANGVSEQTPDLINGAVSTQKATIDQTGTYTEYRAPGVYFLRDALVERDQSLADAARPTSVLEEFEVYVFEQDATGKPQREVPVKEHDHGMDCVRYFAMYLQTAAPRTLRFSTGSTRPPRRTTGDDDE